MNSNYRNVTIVIFPLSDAGSTTPLLNLVKLASGIANKVYLLSGGTDLKNLESLKNVYVIKIMHKAYFNLIGRILSYIHTEFKILSSMISLCRVADLFIFFIGGEILVLPMLTLKLLRKKVIMMPGGIAEKGYAIRKDPLTKPLSLLIKFNMNLCDKLVVYSPYLIKEGRWDKYCHKIHIAHEHIVDFATFKMIKKVNERPNLVGYVGRLSEEKGVLNFVKAVTLLKERMKVSFIICGQGNLTNEIQRIIKSEDLGMKVRLTGWIPHDTLPNHLNEIKLLVLPSYTEGLPNILLEAMACGTPVLATSVGAIPDIIKDGETGFLLESNDPKHIANRIIELLSKPELLEKVSKNAYEYVRANFSFERTLEAWQRIFAQLELTRNQFHPQQ